MNITLMAHDKKKELMVQFCTAYKSILAKHNLSATAATGRLVSEATGLPVVQHAVQRRFVSEIRDQLAEPILPIDIYMKKPWEITMEEDI